LFSVLLQPQKRAGENQYSYDICMLEVLIDLLNFVGNKIGLQVVVILQILFLCVDVL